MKTGKTNRLGKGWILLLILMYLAHNDFWNWGNPALLLGLPVVLVYHLFYCLAVTLVFYSLTRSVKDSAGDSE